MAHLKKQAKIVSERIPVEKIYHPFVCGPNNAIIRKLMEETGARIDVPPPGLLMDEIVVFGDKNGVYKCKTTIIGIYQEKKLKCQTMSVQVKKFQHKYVVGPDGSYLQEILANTGVSVEVPHLESPSERITLRGEQEKLGLALKMVYSKANGVICAFVNAPEWLHKFIKKGENIRRITQDCPRIHVEFLQGKDKIQVEGPQNEVLHAVAALQDNVNELESHMDFAEVEIEQQFHKHIIGKAGANIRRITSETGVMIHIPMDGDKSNIIRIEGDRKKVENAKQQVMEIASRMERQMAFTEIKIEQQFHKYVIGKISTEIRRIINETGAMIHIPPRDVKNPIILIEGESKGVERAKQQLMEMASRLEKNTKKELIIDQRFHRIIFGAKRKTIQGIQGQFNQVQITFQAQGKRSDIVTLRGPKSDVDKCAVYLVKLAKELIPEETRVDLPSENSSSDMITIIGKKAAETKIEKINDKQLISETGKRRILIGQVSHKRGKRSYSCNVCNKIFSTKRGRKKHKRHYKGKKDCQRYVCSVRKKDDLRKAKLWHHFHHKDFRRYGCNICDEEHLTKKDPWQHLCHQKDFRRYDCCNICGEEHSTKKDPWQHLCHQKDFRCNKHDEESSERRETCQHLHRHKDISTYQCDICGKIFSTKREMKEHRRHKDIRPYQCNICDDGYSTQRELWQHLRVHKDFRCNKCNNFDEEYPVEMQPEQHFPAYEDFRPSERVIKRMEAVGYGRHCKKITLYEIGGFQEILSKTEKRKLCKSCQCKFCSKRFSRNSEPEQDKKNHNGDLNHHKCDFCDEILSTMSELEQHKKQHEEFRPHQCGIWGKGFSTKSGMEQHMRDHKDVGHCQCDICGKKFSTKTDMEEHRQHHTEFRLHQCGIWGKGFSTKSGMEQHMRDHKVVGRIHCDIHGKRFLTQKGMKDHKQYHEDVGHCQCDICGKKFSTKTQMEEHRRHHAGDLNQHKCDFCDQIFSTMNELEQHTKQHEDFRPYQCDVCSERFATKNGMKQHKRHHKDIKPYQCDICEKKFTTKRGMEQHRQHHYGSMVLSKRQ